MTRTPKLKKLMFSVLVLLNTYKFNLQEENDEENNLDINKPLNNNKYYSPRVIVHSDKLEDFNIHLKSKSSVSHFFLKDPTETIAEDNNENIVETEIIHKRSNTTKILDWSMDKSDVIDNINDLNFIDFEEKITEAIEEDPEDDDNFLSKVKCN